MPTFDVSVEKRMYATGVVRITARNATAAEEKVDNLIATGKLQTTGVDWSEPAYEEMSFQTTGDVD